MASIEWTHKMSVGVPELDNDHKGLLAVINQLEAHGADEAGQVAVRRSLNWLLRYAQTHFAREQAVLTQCKYPQLSEHIDEHRDFVNWMKETIAAFDESPARATAETRDDLITYLENWWRHHILVEDRKYKSCAQENPTQSSRAAREVRGYDIWWG
ncbi:MAG: hemerythrin family protein [Alphaproteobacteria bacterium]|nr:hemerythrin family protein [Alphaproteobacteria bacterium]